MSFNSDKTATQTTAEWYQRGRVRSGFGSPTRRTDGGSRRRHPPTGAEKLQKDFEGQNLKVGHCLGHPLLCFVCCIAVYLVMCPASVLSHLPHDDDERMQLRLLMRIHILYLSCIGVCIFAHVSCTVRVLRPFCIGFALVPPPPLLLRFMKTLMGKYLLRT